MILSTYMTAFWFVAVSTHAFVYRPSDASFLSSHFSLAFVPSQRHNNNKQTTSESVAPSSWILYSKSHSSSSPTSRTQDEAPTAAMASNAQEASAMNARRRELLSRKGPHFFLDRSSGRIEFGATARLVTELSTTNTDRNEASSTKLIADWLRDEDSFAMSIWRPDLIERKGDNVYRLQLMTLQFVTLQLAPWVDLRMKTVSDSQGLPVFTLQSVGFDPNVKILPGVRISAETLGIVIEVAGQLRASPDGKGVTGSIAFETQGKLPVAFRLIPDAALKRASDAINQTVVNFAIKSFRTGAINNFQKFLKQRTM